MDFQEPTWNASQPQETELIDILLNNNLKAADVVRELQSPETIDRLLKAIREQGSGIRNLQRDKSSLEAEVERVRGDLKEEKEKAKGYWNKYSEKDHEVDSLKREVTVLLTDVSMFQREALEFKKEIRQLKKAAPPKGRKKGKPGKAL